MNPRSLVRKVLPKGLQDRARETYLAAGAVTAPWRMTPSFIMVGASRSGTTTLFRALAEHPQTARPPVNKGVRYFDLNYERGWNWYLGHFPLRAGTERQRRREGQVQAFEASGYYLYHPLVPERMAKDLPDVKLVATLRDPVERAFSAWKHESARGFEQLPFAEALAHEDERLAAGLAELAKDPFHASHALRHQSHRARGEYITQLRRYLEHFPREHLHVIVAEDFFARPEEEFDRLLDFLGMARFRPAGGFPQQNARPSAPMATELREQLAAHYAPFNDDLERLLGRALPWA